MGYSVPDPSPEGGRPILVQLSGCQVVDEFFQDELMIEGMVSEEFFQPNFDTFRVLESPLGFFPETFPDDSVERFGNSRVEFPRRPAFFVNDFFEDLLLFVLGEGFEPGEEFVEEDSQGKDVGGGGYLFAQGLLRGHVVVRSDNGAQGGEVFVVLEVGYSEVEDFDLP